MKFLILLCLFYSSTPQKGDGERFNVLIPTAEQEAAYIWRTIQDIHFFDENGYQVSLPQGAFIESLKEKSRNNQLTDNDYSELKKFIKSTVYKKSDYLKGYEAVKNDLPLLHKMFKHIASANYAWGFKTFESYDIVLTLYGPGGSYNPDKGSILLYTTQDGRFKQYDKPINTLIHEVVHIGIEESIITEFQVSHGLKERIVDSFVLLHFKSQLSDYRIQQMGDTAIDTYLQTVDDLSDLDDILKKFTNQ